MAKSGFATGGLDPLNEREMRDLGDFLESEKRPPGTLGLTSLDGYMTAMVSSSILPGLDQWLPGVFDLEEMDESVFDTPRQAQRIIEFLLRYLNELVGSLAEDAVGFQPVFDEVSYEGDEREYLDGEGWAIGFIRYVAMNRAAWQPLFDDPAGEDWLKPFVLLGTEDLTEEEMALTDSPEKREALSIQVQANVAPIFEYWAPYREAVAERTIAETIRRTGPKVGRNDPCPCGSGKKFKKCCGAAADLQ